MFLMNFYSVRNTTQNMRVFQMFVEGFMENLSRKFAIKNLNCDKIKTYFQDNLKTHIMKTRHPEQHNVTFAHTQ